MKPAYMTRYGHGQGDCLTACVASLLECEVGELPNFSDYDKTWLKHTAAWLRRNGFVSIWMPGETIDAGGVVVDDSLCIVVLKTDAEDHACIGRWRTDFSVDGEWKYEIEEVFDPNARERFDRNGIRGALFIFSSADRLKYASAAAA